MTSEQRPVTIRAGEYRGKRGFKVRGGGCPGWFPAAIFVETRRAAEMCKAAILSGDRITEDHLLGIVPLWWDTDVVTAALQSIYNAEDEYVGTVAMPGPCHLCGTERGPRRLVAPAGVVGWECLSHGPRLGQIADRRHGGRS